MSSAEPLVEHLEAVGAQDEVPERNATLAAQRLPDLAIQARDSLG